VVVALEAGLQVLLQTMAQQAQLVPVVVVVVVDG
jgi:hypothetical protein